MSLSSDLTLISDMASRLSIAARDEAGKAVMSYKLHSHLLQLFKKLETIECQLNDVLVEIPDVSYFDHGEEDLSAYVEALCGEKTGAGRKSFDSGEPHPVCSNLLEFVAFWGRDLA